MRTKPGINFFLVFETLCKTFLGKKVSEYGYGIGKLLDNCTEVVLDFTRSIFTPVLFRLHYKRYFYK